MRAFQLSFPKQKNAVRRWEIGVINTNPSRT